MAKYTYLPTYLLKKYENKTILQGPSLVFNNKAVEKSVSQNYLGFSFAFCLTFCKLFKKVFRGVCKIADISCKLHNVSPGTMVILNLTKHTTSPFMRN